MSDQNIQQENKHKIYFSFRATLCLLTESYFIVNKNQGKEVIFITRFRLVDSPMGSGKTTATINHINYTEKYYSNDSIERVMVCVPYIEQVDRFLKNTKLKTPKTGIKLDHLKMLIEKGENIVITHALFNTFDSEVIDLLTNSKYKYDLFHDEQPQFFQGIIGGDRGGDFGNCVLDNIGQADLLYLVKNGILLKKEDKFVWNTQSFYNCEKKMIYEPLKELCSVADLYYYGVNKFDKSFPACLITFTKPKVFASFNSVWILSYQLKGSIVDSYFALNNISDVEYYHVEDNKFKEGYKFEYPKGLNRIILHQGKYNFNFGLSKNWYFQNGNKENLDYIGKCSYNYLRYIFGKKSFKSKDYIWTTFSGYELYISKANKSFSKSRFVPCNTKATNEYKDSSVAIYLCNRYPNVMLQGLLNSKGLNFDDKLFALSELLQFVFRTDIRNVDSNKPINVFVPNRRMRELFAAWLKEGKDEQYLTEKVAA